MYPSHYSPISYAKSRLNLEVSFFNQPNKLTLSFFNGALAGVFTKTLIAPIERIKL